MTKHPLPWRSDGKDDYFRLIVAANGCNVTHVALTPDEFDAIVPLVNATAKLVEAAEALLNDFHESNCWQLTAALDEYRKATTTRP